MRTGVDRVREKLEKLRRRVEAGKLSDAAKIGAAAERIMQAHYGYRYYRWRVDQGRFFFEDPVHPEPEKRIEGKYLIATSEAERGFRCLKDVLEMRPIYHKSERRVRAHIFAAALALLLTRVLERRLKDAGVELSTEEALRAPSTIRMVSSKVGAGSARIGVGAGSPRTAGIEGLGDCRGQAARSPEGGRAGDRVAIRKPLLPP
jgi:hypothetical protein